MSTWPWPAARSLRASSSGMWGMTIVPIRLCQTQTRTRPDHFNLPFFHVQLASPHNSFECIDSIDDTDTRTLNHELDLAECNHANLKLKSAPAAATKTRNLHVRTNTGTCLCLPAGYPHRPFKKYFANQKSHKIPRCINTNESALHRECDGPAELIENSTVTMTASVSYRLGY